MIWIFWFITWINAEEDVAQDITEVPKQVLLDQKDAVGETIGVRMKMVTESLLGHDYILNGIGENTLPDTDPLVRYDGFDCLTFVEEALALSLSTTEEARHWIRKDLRYGKGKITYKNRNHFMISQWIPNAIEQGYLKDITHTVGETHLVSKTITHRTWERWKGRRHFHIPPSKFPVGTYQLGVLSLDAAIQAIPYIPEGALVVVMRQNNPYNPVWITHLGFVVRYSDKDVRIRHATKMAGGTVKEHYLKWYFEHIRLHLAPMEGILVLMPQDIDVSDRVSPLTLPSPLQLESNPQQLPTPQ